MLGLCDHSLITAWYRLTGDAGTYLPESCPQPQADICGATYPGWLNGIHPTTAEGVVTRAACFSSDSQCCYYHTSIKVKNCADYYVYELAPVPACSVRYCVTNVGEYVPNSCTHQFALQGGSEGFSAINDDVTWVTWQQNGGRTRKLSVLKNWHIPLPISNLQQFYPGNSFTQYGMQSQGCLFRHPVGL